MISTNKFKSDTFTITKLFFTWLQIGFTSFGGGTTTQYLIQEQFIYKHKWITDEEYANIIGMCQITPGMNIIAYTILIGKKLAGGIGIFISLVGLILPSAAVTIVLTTIYTSISKSSKVHSALHAVFAAIFGIALATNWRNVQPIIIKNYKRGSMIFGVTIAIMIGSGAIYIFLNPSVILLYVLGGLCGAAAYWYISKKEVRVNK
ncbi:chromate transporter [Clostridium autoethanogenum]|uniref:Chromate transporter n=1 Tax=Clostridium autoethanogenum TaxID=84023 RepID=A0A3M0SV61_9CLOT|nr:chromate transporter [Clostridium autoethanogenum]RMD02309.1 chromate transporter [Clostridium autoethanogenum]